MPKGTLEGIVLAPPVRPARVRLRDHGVLRDQRFSDIDEFWRTWGFPADRLEQLRTGGKET
ncbi:hypothetical protein ABGB14_34870 [Nonomuraea sp. B10E15]|uniref:hypothetical protein n=1 Tax=Nonomuraea sp. B10E15 TaxID=3153560 RepID=UPI00325D9566